MKRLGIIGAENSHTAAIAKLLNIDRLVEGFEVTHVWGETPELARGAAGAGSIPKTVKRPEDMLGEVDCVMVDHRDGKHHLEAVTPFVKAKVPVFVDKPMTTSLAEGKRFLKLRKRLGVAVTTMSSVPHQASVSEIKRKLERTAALKAVHLNGPGDPKSKYGGVFFYGIHQVDLMVELLGAGAVEVTSVMNGPAFTAVVSYPDGLTATIGMPGAKGFSVAAVGAEGVFHEPVVNDANAYLPTTRLFTAMFETGEEPFTDERMLAPVAILEAMRESLSMKKRVKVPSFN